MTSLYHNRPDRLTPESSSAKIPLSLEGLTSPQFIRAMGEIEQLSSQLPLDSCASNLSDGTGWETPEAQELSGNFHFYWTDCEGVDSHFAALTQRKELAMLLTKSTPMPTVAKVLSVRSLVARGHTNTDNPWVSVGAVVKVNAVEDFAGRSYARFEHQGVTCYLPAPDLEEICLGDASDFQMETEENLWLQVLDRLDRLPAHEAQTELDSLLDNVRAAGGTSEVFVVFAQSWLSVVRA